MMAAKTASKVSTVALLIVVVTVVVSTTFSDAFIPPPSVTNFLARNELQHDGFSTTNSCNDRSSCLFASTLPSKSGSGIVVINSWKLLPDGRIKGVMADSGDSVLTSPLKKKNGLKEKTTVRTVSGSRYKLGTPALAVGVGNNLTADRLGVPRATLGGINDVRATQPLNSNPMASQDGFMQNFLANKGRATMPLRSDGDGSIDSPKKKNGLLKPLVGGASAIAIGAAIGTGVVSDKGIDLSKIKNVPDPSEVLKSAKSLHLPDIRSIKAPVIPSPGVSFPKFEGFPSISAPKLPGVGIKMPDLQSLTIPVPDGVKKFGDATGDAVGDALESTGIKLPKSPFAEKKPQVASVGQGPYRVPMPYLDRQILDAEKERKSEEEAKKVLATEREEAARIQKIREETEAKVMARQAELMTRQNTQREQELQKRLEEEARLKQDANERVIIAEQEATRLRAEVEQARLLALAKEKAAAEETTQLKKEAEVALLKEQAAKEEFTRKIQEAELAKLKEAQNFAVKLAEAEEAAVKERALEEESIAKQKMAEEAASRQAIATAEVRTAEVRTAEVRKASIGATAARKASYSSPSLSTYEGWQERQRTEYQTRIGTVAERKVGEGAAQSPNSGSQDNLSTYKRWQQNVAAKQLVSMSTEPVKAAYVTGAQPPVANKLVSGTTKLSEAAIALNSDLGYVIAGSAALLGGIAYAYENQKIQDELSQYEKMQPVASKSVAPPPATSAPVQPIPPIVPPSSMVQAKQEVATSATMAIDAKPYVEVSGDEGASVTKEISPPPPPTPPEGSYSSFNGPPTSITSASDATEAAKQTQAAADIPDVINNQRTYLDSMPKSSGGNAELKSSYSPFSNPQKTSSNDSLYNPPSTALPQAEEKYEDPSTLKGSSNEAYIESMSASGDSPKASYSPFGTPKIRSNDPPDTSPADGTNIDKQAAVNGGSYLDSLPSPSGNRGANLKASYSPFGTPKVTENISLSTPLGATSILENYEASTPPLSEESYVETLPSSSSETVPTSNDDSYLNALNDSSASNVKKSYAPFGRKPKTIDNKGLYSPGNS